MSFTTRCPACGTMFRVVPDQLKISDGWVRCGHCSDVFDAMLNLQSEASIAAAKSPPPPPPGPSGSASSSSRVVTRRVPVPQPAHPVAASPSPRPLIVQRPAPVPPAAPVEPPAPPPATVALPPPDPVADPGWDFVSQLEEPEDEDPVSVPAADDNWDGDWLLSPRSVSQHRDAVKEEMRQTGERDAADQAHEAQRSVSEAFERELDQFAAAAQSVEHDVGDGGNVDKVSPVIHREAQTSSWPSEDSGFGAESSEPGFVVQGRREAFWRRPAVRAGLLLLAGLLCGLLAMQWAVHERDQIAARQPATMPWLQSLCHVAGCSLTAPRRIEAVAIDSSTLTRKLGQLYSFDLVVKNSEPMAVAMPALELSLTDGRDKEIARRVFLPEEMPGTPTVVPANGSLSVSMRLSLSESDLGTMAGYRALVFYP